MVEINDVVRGAYNTNDQIKFKTSMSKSSLCDDSDAYILVSGPMKIPNTRPASKSNNRKKIKIKNCIPSIDCVIEINNTQIDNGKDIDVVVYNLTTVKLNAI